MPAVGVDLVLGKVEADGAALLAELDRKRQADVSETDHCKGCHTKVQIAALPPRAGLEGGYPAS